MGKLINSKMTEKKVKNKEPVTGLLRSFFLDAPKSIDKQTFRKVLLCLVLTRVVVLSIILAVSAWGLSSLSINNVANTIGVIFAASLLNILAIRLWDRIYLIGYLQLTLDVMLVTISIYFTGSLALAPLYLLIVIGGSSLLSTHGAVVISGLCGLCYSIFVSGLVRGNSASHVHMSAYEILTSYLTLVTIALVSSYIARRIEKLRNLASKHKEDLTALNVQQKKMMNELNEGIITIDINNVITNINEAAKSIVCLSNMNREEIIGRNFESILKDLGITQPQKVIADESDNNTEIKFKNDNGLEITLNYASRPLNDIEGNQCGRLLMFRDISRQKSIEEKLSLHEKMTQLISSSSENVQLTDDSLLPINETLKIIGKSESIKYIFNLINKVADSDASVLIHGESGTGKELIAKAIHVNSNRRDKPFVAINCSAIPENLIESELFGHKKGSFTGAVADNIGLFRQAHNGVIFLDEIGDLPLALQAKLLRVLQDKTVRAVGDTKDTAIDVRVIAATHRDLKQETESKRFREDLYYRLNVVKITAPPLRERREDIALLVRHFLEKYSDQVEALPTISPDALALLNSYSFPGNIRELENIIERAIVLGGQAILPEHLPDEVKSLRSWDISSNRESYMNDTTNFMQLPIDLESELAKFEKLCLDKALEESNGVKKKAAALLGLNFRSLRYRLKKYGLGDRSDEEEQLVSLE